MKYDIITFGSAVIDIFLAPEKFHIARENHFISGEGLCFPLGSKIAVEEMNFGTGGGGTNTACSLSLQGFKTAYAGGVGNDIGGREIKRELEDFSVDTGFIKIVAQKPTNFSVVLTVPGKDRTIFVYRGASESLLSKDCPWTKLKTKWIYLAPLSGKLCGLFEPIVNFAKKNNIRVAANPGNTQLSLPKKTLERIVRKIDILILNQEEAALLTKLPYHKETAIFKEIDKMCPGISVMTKGAGGAVASDGKFIYKAESLKAKVVDKTGAGDAFSAGFLTGFIREKGDIESALQLGIANATSCIQKWGAKKGFLKKGQLYRKTKVKKSFIRN